MIARLIAAGVAFALAAILFVIAIILAFVIGGKGEGCDNNAGSIGKATGWILIVTAILVVISLIILLTIIGTIPGQVLKAGKAGAKSLKACAEGGIQAGIVTGVAEYA